MVFSIVRTCLRALESRALMRRTKRDGFVSVELLVLFEVFVCDCPMHFDPSV